MSVRSPRIKKLWLLLLLVGLNVWKGYFMLRLNSFVELRRFKQKDAIARLCVSVLHRTFRKRPHKKFIYVNNFISSTTRVKTAIITFSTKTFTFDVGKSIKIIENQRGPGRNAKEKSLNVWTESKCVVRPVRSENRTLTLDIAWIDCHLSVN